MKVAGCAVEINPFHKGHARFFKEAGRLSGAQYLIAVSSGDFVQRGAPAFMEKKLRAKAALMNGADLVLELPLRAATGTAERFAEGAVSVLSACHVVTHMAFGAEYPDTEALKDITLLINEEPNPYKDELRKALKEGASYPAAREKAVLSCAADSERPLYSKILQSPNCILALEYLRALERQRALMEPVAVERTGSAYHSADLMSEQFASAGALRAVLQEVPFNSPLPGSFTGQIPENTHALLAASFGTSFPVYEDDLSLLLRTAILEKTAEELTAYEDVDEALANRIVAERNAFTSWTQFCMRLKNKSLTYTRISRALLHILLGIKKQDPAEPAYLRVLGFRKDAAPLLTAIKKSASVPLITCKQEADALSGKSADLFRESVRASNLYMSVVSDKFRSPFVHEFAKPLIVI